MHTRWWGANWPKCVLVLVVGAAALGQTTTRPVPPPTTSPSTSPASAPAAAEKSLDPEVDKILTRLEERQVRDLQARLTWKLQYVIEPDATIKRGEVWYQKGTPSATFLIRFREVIAGKRKDKIDERHKFDGFWYTKLDSAARSYEETEIRRPDDPVDPYKVGQGVFPVPFGQKKADILREFGVQQVEPVKDDPPATDHLRLVPREATRTGEEYKELDFWISREGATAGLPVKVVTAKLDGTGKVNSYITLTFEDVKLNQGISTAVFQLECPPSYQRTRNPLIPAAAPADAGAEEQR